VKWFNPPLEEIFIALASGFAWLHRNTWKKLSTFQKVLVIDLIILLVMAVVILKFRY
jgi:hypothetical protein